MAETETSTQPETTVYIFYAPFLEFGLNPTIVFQHFTINTTVQLFGALGAVAGIAFLFHLLAALKDRLYNRYLHLQRLRVATDVDTGEDDENCDGCSCMLFLFLTGLHVVQTICGIILLLIAATFNGWLIIAIIGGSTFGYLCGLWKCCCDHPNGHKVP